MNDHINGQLSITDFIDMVVDRYIFKNNRKSSSLPVSPTRNRFRTT